MAAYLLAAAARVSLTRRRLVLSTVWTNPLASPRLFRLSNSGIDRAGFGAFSTILRRHREPGEV
jgi:hypothetical protein